MGDHKLLNYRLFERIDIDKDNSISQTELKALITDINFGKISWNEDEAVAKIMAELDLNGDQAISEEEFISVFEKWLDPSRTEEPKSSVSEDHVFQVRNSTQNRVHLIVPEKK